MISRVVVSKEVADSIYHLQFRDEYLMCSSLLRFQEHYECPKFKGKIFTLEQYMDYYANTFGNFTYFQDIGGFNIPSYALKKFYEGKFDPLTEKEKNILKIFADVTEPFYIIATTKKSATYENDFIHEMAHGLFYVDDEYKKAVRRILRGQDLSSIYHYLKDKYYHRAHFFDEAQALLLEDAESFSRTGAKASDFAGVRRQLKKAFNEHFKPKRSKSERFKV